MKWLKEQDEFDNIFDYIDYLEMAFEYIYDEMAEEYDLDEMKFLVDKINTIWYEGDD